MNVKTPRLTFDEATHKYCYIGEVVPSVTQILARANPYGMRFVNPEALKRGTKIHAEIAEWLEGDGWPKPTGYLAQAVRFLEDVNACVIDFEAMGVHRDYRYAYRLDLIVKIGRAIWLIDWKCNTLPVSVGPQTAAYQKAWDSTHKRNRIDMRAAVVLHEDRYEFIPASHPKWPTDFRMDWTKFKDCLNG